MRHNDNLILETLEKKNDLESYIYKMRDYLAKEFVSFIQPEQIPAFLQHLYFYLILVQLRNNGYTTKV